MITKILKKLSAGSSLSEGETATIFEAMIGEGEISDAQIGAYLALTAGRELRSEELIAGARSLRAHMLPVEAGVPVLDTCGTGGSGLDTFSTSTTASLVVAACGQPVAKHGNRAASSRSGSADLIEALGIPLEGVPVEKLQTCLQKTNFCFIFARGHHPATKRVAQIRPELGFRTIFNFLGPLSNPAGATRQLMGVSKREMMMPMAEALMGLGSDSAMIVRGEEGLDEISLCGPTEVVELKSGEISSYKISPEDFDLKSVDLEEISGAPAGEMAARVRGLLGGEPSAYRELVLLNAGAALYVSGKSTGIKEGVAMAAAAIDSGAAAAGLEKIVECMND